MANFTTTVRPVKSYNFWLLTVEWLLGEAAILLVLAKQWRVLVAEPGPLGPFALVVLILVGMVLAWMWNTLWEAKAHANPETTRIVQRLFFVACWPIIFLVVALGSWLNHTP